MKKRIALLAALILALAVSCAGAETVISVTGTGETRVAADTAVISLGVSARDRDVLKAQQTVNETVAAIRKALIAKGVPEDCVSTDYMNIYAMYDYRNDVEEISAYNANLTLAVRVTDMDSAGLLIDEAFAAGANTLNGITFSASDTEEAKAESLRKATEEAKKKAEILAEASGMKITGIRTITEGNVYSYEYSADNFAARGAEEAGKSADSGTVVQAAKLVVSATVTFAFEAE